MYLYKILILIIALQFLVFGVILYVLLDEINNLIIKQRDVGKSHCFVQQKSRPISQTKSTDANLTLKELRKGSSAYCHGKSKTERICKFQNLCYHSKWKKFIIFHGPWTTLQGVPLNRFDPAFLDLSSVDDHNTQYFNYVDFPAHALDDFHEIKIIEDFSIIFNRFNPENLMHVFHDDLLPLFATLKRFETSQNPVMMKLNTKLVFMDGREAGVYHNLYKKLTKQPILFERNLTHELSCFKEVIVGLSKETTWYQYGFKIPQGPIENKSTDKATLGYFAKHLKYIFNCTKSESKYVILISRKQTRLILNQIEVSLALANIFKKELYLLDLEDVEVADAVCLINQATVIVGMHGAELILSLFLNPGSTLIELFPYGINPDNYTPYKTLAKLLNLKYIAWTNQDLHNTKGYPERPQRLGGIKHLTEEKQLDIINAKTIPRHLCCDNPYWLYKIYQDTTVDIPSLEQQISLSFGSQNHSQGQTDPLFPDTVQNISCVIESADSGKVLKIDWQEPVNSKFLNGDLVYQVLVQEGSDDSEVNAYELTDLHLSLTKHSSTVSCRVWLRAKYNHKFGPLSSTIHCQEQ